MLHIRIRTLMIAVPIMTLLIWHVIALFSLFYGPAYDAWVDTGDAMAYWRELPGWWR